jgi:pimeloyl-ACP methyl ester carboxylesterase
MILSLNCYFLPSTSTSTSTSSLLRALYSMPKLPTLAAALAAALAAPGAAAAFAPLAPLALAPVPRTFASPHAASATATASASAVPDPVPDPTFVRPDTEGEGGITEQACTEAASRMRRVMVPVPPEVAPGGTVGISYVHWEADPVARERLGPSSPLPLLLVHGFDSSCLEYRRLGPRLAALGLDAYAVDLLGWGYTQLDGVGTFSAEAKVAALGGFWEVVGNSVPVCVAGASLGGAAAIEYAAANPDVVRGTVLIDAQGFVDGVGPMALLPVPLARLGVGVLRSVPLRSSANTMSYADPGTYATEDALRVGRMHCLRDGWEDALVSFMRSGGFTPSAQVARLYYPSLVLWGRQDTILEKEFAQRFLDVLPDPELRWVEDCGHVPHLEQPDRTAGLVLDFLTGEKFAGNRERDAGAGAGAGADEEDAPFLTK